MTTSTVTKPGRRLRVSHHGARRAARGADGAREAVGLTRREHEVMSLIAEGLSNKDIAARLHIVVHTVKSHVHAILEKLALRTRLEIAAFALRPRAAGPPLPPSLGRTTGRGGPLTAALPRPGYLVGSAALAGHPLQ